MPSEGPLAERNRAARERLRDRLSRLTDEELRRPLEGGWTVAAALCHLAFWDRRARLLLERLERIGAEPEAADIDLLNDGLLDEWLAIPPREAVRLALEAAEAVDRTVERFSDELVARVLAFGNPMRVDRSLHRQAHLDEIDRALGG